MARPGGACLLVLSQDVEKAREHTPPSTSTYYDAPKNSMTAHTHNVLLIHS